MLFQHSHASLVLTFPGDENVNGKPHAVHPAEGLSEWGAIPILSSVTQAYLLRFASEVSASSLSKRGPHERPVQLDGGT